MPPVVVLGVPGKELSHEDGDTLLAASHQEVNMGFHEHPRIEGRLRLKDILPQAGKKARPILVVVKNIRPADSPHHDMVQDARSI
jgi:hypothetical protein